MPELLPPLNDHSLPWMNTIHPIGVHVGIAMGLIPFVFDLIGVLTRRSALFEVSFWNRLFAAAAIFVATIFGQVEAGLAKPYGASRDIRNLHSMNGALIVVQVPLGNQLMWDPMGCPMPCRFTPNRVHFTIGLFVWWC